MFSLGITAVENLNGAIEGVGYGLQLPLEFCAREAKKCNVYIQVLTSSISNKGHSTKIPTERLFKKKIPQIPDKYLNIITYLTLKSK